MIHLPSSRALAGTIGILALMAALASHYWAPRGDCPVDNPSISLQIRDAQLLVEVAANNEARYCGLAFRDHLPPDSGMLFVYSTQQTLEFWMKDTRVPLALAFIDDGRRVTEIHQLTPDMGERSVMSARPALFALETNPDWFSINGISLGDKVNFVLPDELSIE